MPRPPARGPSGTPTERRSGVPPAWPPGRPAHLLFFMRTSHVAYAHAGQSDNRPDGGNGGAGSPEENTTRSAVDQRDKRHPPPGSFIGAASPGLLTIWSPPVTFAG